jgi:hypothetical protein
VENRKGRANRQERSRMRLMIAVWLSLIVGGIVVYSIVGIMQR